MVLECKYGEGIGGLPVTTQRNFFGRQNESFVGVLEKPGKNRNLCLSEDVNKNLEQGMDSACMSTDCSSGSPASTANNSRKSSRCPKEDIASSSIVSLDNDNPFPDGYRAIFIRGPAITEIHDSSAVKVLGAVRSNGAGKQSATNSDSKLVNVACEADNIFATCFHPELLENDTRIHEYFLRKALFDGIERSPSDTAMDVE